MSDENLTIKLERKGNNLILDSQKLSRFTRTVGISLIICFVLVLIVVIFPSMFTEEIQFETEIRAERQRDGIEKAKQRGVRSGRKKALNEERVIELRKKRKAGVLIKDLMSEYHISKVSVYRYLSGTR